MSKYIDKSKEEILTTGETVGVGMGVLLSTDLGYKVFGDKIEGFGVLEHILNTIAPKAGEVLSEISNDLGLAIGTLSAIYLLAKCKSHINKKE
jgi:hypothetical protein